jgi:hypothetical protein
MCGWVGNAKPKKSQQAQAQAQPTYRIRDGHTAVPALVLVASALAPQPAQGTV